MHWLLLEEHPVAVMALPIQLPYYMFSPESIVWQSSQTHSTAIQLSCFRNRRESQDEVPERQHVDLVINRRKRVIVDVDE